MTEIKEVVPVTVPEKKVYSMEIEYTYKHDKESELQTSWYYHWVECDNLKKATLAAKKYFTEMVTNTGWTAKVKIISIHEMQNDKSTATTKVVTTTQLPPARAKKATGTPRKSPTAKTTTPRAPRKPRTTKPKALPL